MSQSKQTKRTRDSIDNDDPTLQKKVKLEDDGSGSFPDDIDMLLSQPINGNSQAGQSIDQLDFHNLPDELLDSVGASIQTPDLAAKNLSRSATPISLSGPTEEQRKSAPTYQLNRAQSNLSHTLALPQTHTQHQQPSLTNSGGTNLHTNDPSKLNDALAAAGVDIQKEEELLMQQRMNRLQRVSQSQSFYGSQRNAQPSNFLYPTHISSYMLKIARHNGLSQNFLQEPELLELISASCEDWLANIVTKTLIMSRHRQNSAPMGKPKTGNVKADYSQEFRNLAKKHREMEEKRVERRIVLGLEGSDDKKNDGNKAGADETLHRAANATAAMMTTGKKKYSWMTSGAAGSNGSAGAAAEKDNSRKSHLLVSRGENGIRITNTRMSQAITMRDLLSAVEDERMGVEKVIIKGYSKLRD